jgi:hypothetical protein
MAASSLCCSPHAVLGLEFYRRLSPPRLEQVRDSAIREELLGLASVTAHRGPLAGPPMR